MDLVQDATIQAKALNKKDKARLSRLRQKAAQDEKEDQTSVKIQDSSFDEIVK